MHDSVSRKRALTDLNLTAYKRCRVLSNGHTGYTCIACSAKESEFISQNFAAKNIVHSAVNTYTQDCTDIAALTQ